MKLERKDLVGRVPILEIKSSRVISEEHIDSYGNHLNQALALTIFEDERLKIFPKELTLKPDGLTGVVREQHAIYYSQVYNGENVNVTTSLYVERARLYFLHQMFRDEKLVLDDLVEATIVDSEGSPKRIPSELLQELQSYHPFNIPQGGSQE